jgi:hypothetical protein
MVAGLPGDAEGYFPVHPPVSGRAEHLSGKKMRQVWRDVQDRGSKSSSQSL